MKKFTPQKQFIEKSSKDFETQWKQDQEESLVQIYGSSQLQQYQPILWQLNQNNTKAVCAKQMGFGDVAWRCLDCEKDPTCIICQSCFEKGDHTGHRIQLKRNVGGCCDCGDPEAWDENHFCSDHKGTNNIDPKIILQQIPATIKNSAIVAFRKMAQDLKWICMLLQNYDSACLKFGMTNEQFKRTMIKGVQMSFNFFEERIEEIPAFAHIIDQVLTLATLDESRFLKNEDHKTCCKKCFTPNDIEEKQEHEEVFLTHELADQLCFCSPLDLVLQTNHIIDDKTRKIVYEFAFKMFSSQRFKQRLTLSFASNYEYLILRQLQDCEDHISTIGVQLLTSDEMSMLIFKEKDLRNTILEVFTKLIIQFKAKYQDRTTYQQIFEVLCHLKYMARPESLKFAISKTDFLQKFIFSLTFFHFGHVLKKKSTMVTYAQEGQISHSLIETEKLMIKVGMLYLRELPTHLQSESDWEICHLILKEFYNSFTLISKEFNDKNLDQNTGFYNLPVHRLFAYFITRVLFHSKIQNDQFIIGDRFQLSLRDTFFYLFYPDQRQQIIEQQTASTLVDYGSLDSCNGIIDKHLKELLVVLVKNISFVHEIISRKWVYSGIYLEQYPDIYYSLQDEFLYQDICLSQILITLENNSNPGSYESQISITDTMINSFGLDNQLQILFQGLKEKKISQGNFKSEDKSIRFAPEKLRQQLTIFLRFLIQNCLLEVSFIKQLYNRRDQKSEKQHHIQTQNSIVAKNLWGQVLKKEAIHVLLLNKQNSSIETVKETLVDFLVKDEDLINELFQVSIQSRDQKNQVTFKLKPEYFKQFDPYYYVQPDQHSQIFQMFQQNQQLKERQLSEGINDFVGDYLNNHEASTSINDYIGGCFAKSQIIFILLPLITIWLKHMKDEIDPIDENIKKEQEIQQSEEYASMMSTILRDLVQFQRNQESPSGEVDIQQIQQVLGQYDQIKQKTEQIQATLEDEPTVQYDEIFLHKIIDTNIGNHCFKLLTIILRCAKSEQEKKNILDGFKKNYEVIKFIQEYKNEIDKICQSEESSIPSNNQRLTQFLAYLLSQIYHLSPQDFPNLKESLLMGPTPQQPQRDDQKVLKKDDIKKRQSKLLAKMKDKGNKFLQNQAIQDDSKIEDEKVCINCSFCQEELLDKNFASSPYGNLAFCQSTKLYSHSARQTKEIISKGFKNVGLPIKLLELEESKIEEKKKTDEDAWDDISDSEDLHPTKFTIENDKMAEVLTDFGKIPIINSVNGGGAVISHCKHYSHVKCLANYYQQSLTTRNNLEQRNIAGLNSNEFLCPICKNISNTLLPSLSLKQIDQESVSDNLMILQMYMRFLSDIALKQQGFINKFQFGAEGDKILQLKKREILLKDLKESPERCFNLVIDSLLHRIALTDLKGVTEYIQNQNCLVSNRIYETLQKLIDIVVFPNEQEQGRQFIINQIIQLRNSMTHGENLFSKPLGTYIQKLILLIRFYIHNDISYFLQIFVQLLKAQALLAVLYRKGISFIESVNDMTLISFEQAVLNNPEAQEIYIDAQLPLIRKLFLAFVISQDQNLINNQIDNVIQANSNQDELTELYKGLGIPEQIQNTEEISNDQFKNLFQGLIELTETQFKNQFMQVQNLQMPNNLILLTPCFQFSLITLPQNFMNLQTEFYKKNCIYCEKQVLDTATCLLCGQTMCWYKVKAGGRQFNQCRVGAVGMQQQEEGLLSWHSRVCEAGNSIFVQTSTASIIMISDGSPGLNDTPYRNRFGELASGTQKNFDEFVIDQQGGGNEQIKQLTKAYLEFKLPNLIVQDRINPDSKYKVYLRNIF